MEINVYSYLVFQNSDEAEFVSNMLSRFGEQPENESEVQKRYKPLFTKISKLDFPENLELTDNYVECEWTFFGIDELKTTIEAFLPHKDIACFHRVSTDGEDIDFVLGVLDLQPDGSSEDALSSFLVTIRQGSTTVSTQFANKNIDDWEADDLFKAILAKYPEI